MIKTKKGTTGNAIGWTWETWNFWEGCTKVTTECKFCYAEGRNKRFSKGENWGEGAARKRTSLGTALAPLRWQKDAAAKGESRLVFTMSLADWADIEVDDAWRDEMFSTVIEKCPNLIFQLLTKRPGNAERYLRKRYPVMCPQNIWLGVSCGVDDMEAITNVNVPVHFISAEPYVRRFSMPAAKFDWVIFGGESEAGSGCRPCDVVSMVSDIEKCQQQGAKVFVKQLGTHPFIEHPPMRGRQKVALTDKKGGNMLEWPDLVPRLREFPAGWTAPVMPAK